MCGRLALASRRHDVFEYDRIRLFKLSRWRFLRKQDIELCVGAILSLR